MTDTTETVITNNKELLDALVPIFVEIDTLENEAKEFKEAADEAGLDYSAVVALAKAKVKGKIGRIEEKAQSTLDLIEELI